MNVHDLLLLVCGGLAGAILTLIIVSVIVVNWLAKVSGGFRNL